MFYTKSFFIKIFYQTISNLFRYFNYRTTQYLASEGFYEFHNWFDDRAWYPLGRIIGGTIYPGKFINYEDLLIKNFKPCIAMQIF